MTKKQQLEVTWIGKENRPKLEPCVVLEEWRTSYRATHRVVDSGPDADTAVTAYRTSRIDKYLSSP